MKRQFDKGPGVTVQIERIQGAIAASRLSLSDSFICLDDDPAILDWLTLYAKGIHAPFLLPISGTSFQREALAAMQQIPFGQTVSYGELAQFCGRPKAARAIGGACHYNPFPLFIPCHRVLQADGSLGGFAFSLEIKRRLLEFEANRRSAS